MGLGKDEKINPRSWTTAIPKWWTSWWFKQSPNWSLWIDQRVSKDTSCHLPYWAFRQNQTHLAMGHHFDSKFIQGSQGLTTNCWTVQAWFCLLCHECNLEQKNSWTKAINSMNSMNSWRIQQVPGGSQLCILCVWKVGWSLHVTWLIPLWTIPPLNRNRWSQTARNWRLAAPFVQPRSLMQGREGFSCQLEWVRPHFIDICPTLLGICFWFSRLGNLSASGLEFRDVLEVVLGTTIEPFLVAKKAPAKQRGDMACQRVCQTSRFRTGHVLPTSTCQVDTYIQAPKHVCPGTRRDSDIGFQKLEWHFETSTDKNRLDQTGLDRTKVRMWKPIPAVWVALDRIHCHGHDLQGPTENQVQGLKPRVTNQR